jgi:hypothetical protein
MSKYSEEFEAALASLPNIVTVLEKENEVHQRRGANDMKILKICSYSGTSI